MGKIDKIFRLILISLLVSFIFIFLVQLFNYSLTKYYSKPSIHWGIYSIYYSIIFSISIFVSNLISTFCLPRFRKYVILFIFICLNIFVYLELSKVFPVRVFVYFIITFFSVSLNILFLPTIDKTKLFNKKIKWWGF